MIMDIKSELVYAMMKYSRTHKTYQNSKDFVHGMATQILL